MQIPQDWCDVVKFAYSRAAGIMSTATSNPSGTTNAVFTKLPRPLAKDGKLFTGYVAFLLYGISVAVVCLFIRWFVNERIYMEIFVLF